MEMPEQRGDNRVTTDYFCLDYFSKDYAKKLISLWDSSIICVGTAGSVGVTQKDLTGFTHSYDLDIEDKEVSIRLTRRHDLVRHVVTDVVPMDNCQFYAVATSKQTIHFVDVSDETHLEGYRLIGLPSVPTCLGYKYEKQGNSKSVLFFGDMEGRIHELWFSKPRIGLFEGKRLAGVEIIKFKNLHSEFVEFRMRVKHHKRPIKKLKCLPDPQACLITSSSDPETSILFQKLQGNYEEFSLGRGSTDFEISLVHRLLVSCNNHCDAEAWHWSSSESFWSMKNKPHTVLTGHSAPVVSVCIKEAKTVFMTLDSKNELRIWDASTRLCKHVVPLNFRLPVSRTRNFLSYPFAILGREDIVLCRGRQIGTIRLISKQLMRKVRRTEHLDELNFEEENSDYQTEQSRTESSYQTSRISWFKPPRLMCNADYAERRRRWCLRRNSPFSALKTFAVDKQGIEPRTGNVFFTFFNNAEI